MKDNNCPNSKERGLEEQLKSFCYEPFPHGVGFPTSNFGKILCTPYNRLQLVLKLVFKVPLSGLWNTEVGLYSFSYSGYTNW